MKISILIENIDYKYIFFFGKNNCGLIVQRIRRQERDFRIILFVLLKMDYTLLKLQYYIAFYINGLACPKR